MKKSTLFCALAGLLLLCSCSDNENEYSLDYRCYFLFDAEVHNVSVIKNALNPLASGIFVYVTTERRNGVRYVLSELNDGKTKGEDALTTEKESRITYALGAYNGLIIGYSSLGNGLYAFDHQCPNCMAESNLYRYPLTWTNNGQWVYCKNCKRSYDLNNNGYPNSDGMKLIRYRAEYNGSILIIHN